MNGRLMTNVWFQLTVTASPWVSSVHTLFAVGVPEMGYPTAAFLAASAIAVDVPLTAATRAQIEMGHNR